MPKFRKKPVVIEAVQWDGESGTANAFIGEAYGTDWQYATAANSEIFIPSPDGKGLYQIGDWIIKEGNGLFSRCLPGLFEETYEPVTAA